MTISVRSVARRSQVFASLAEAARSASHLSGGFPLESSLRNTAQASVFDP